MTGRVYTDPDEPGAPQVGDIVVVAIDGRPGSMWEHCTAGVGHVGELELVYGLGDAGHLWCVYPLPDVHAVRWPTPEELVAYHLRGGSR